MESKSRGQLNQESYHTEFRTMAEDHGKEIILFLLKIFLKFKLGETEEQYRVSLLIYCSLESLRTRHLRISKGRAGYLYKAQSLHTPIPQHNMPFWVLGAMDLKLALSLKPQREAPFIEGVDLLKFLPVISANTSLFCCCCCLFFFSSNENF